MESEIKFIGGEIILKKIDFNRCVEKKVGSNNKTSSKVSLPKELKGKTVYICWKDDSNE